MTIPRYIFDYIHNSTNTYLCLFLSFILYLLVILTVWFLFYNFNYGLYYYFILFFFLIVLFLFLVLKIEFVFFFACDTPTRPILATDPKQPSSCIAKRSLMTAYKIKLSYWGSKRVWSGFVCSEHASTLAALTSTVPGAFFHCVV